MQKPTHVGAHDTNAAKAAREGRLARARGLARADNPFDDPKVADGQRQLRHAWWSGWDEVDAELGASRRNAP